jgi:Outer membrane protein beta-barrel domain
MHAFFVRHARLAVAAIALSPILFAVGAQGAELNGSAVHVAPYLGYMVFGNYLEGPLGSSISSAPGVVYGTQVGLSMSPTVSLVGNVAYTRSDIRIGIPILGGFSVGSSSMLIYDADVQVDLPTSRTNALPFAPFVQAGVGAIRHQVDQSLVRVDATNLAVNVGVGADVMVGRGLALRVMAKDYIGKFDVQEATSLDLSGPTAHNWALSAGLRFDF